MKKISLKSEIIPSPSLNYFFEKIIQDISNFGGYVLEAQVELDNVLGHFGYLLILKRSFLELVIVTDDSG